MADHPEPPHFGNVDHSPSPTRFVHYMDASYSSESSRERNSMRAPLRISAGHRILDVGCGPGNELVALAREVGHAGAAIGIDNSLHMLRAARSRLSPPGSVVAGDAHTLPFHDQSFDAARIERVLQHVANPSMVLAEMARVTRNGGCILAIEPDWATLLVDPPTTVTHEVVNNKAQRGAKNAWIGRELRRMFLELTLRNVQVHFVVGRHEDFAHADKLLGLTTAAQRCADEGVITIQEKTAWIEHLQESSERGTFFASLTRVLVAAEVDRHD